jgi:thioredoxin 1
MTKWADGIGRACLLPTTEQHRPEWFDERRIGEMKTRPWLAAGIVFTLCAAEVTSGKVVVGSTREEVIAELGEPEMEFTRNGKRVLLYYGLELDLADNRVVRIPSNLEREIQKRQTQRKSDQAMIVAGMVKTSGGWAKAPAPQKRVTVPTAGRRGTGHPEGVTVISNGGQRVELSRVLQPGRVTIVDFYADWCGPCRQIAPHLERMASQDQGVDLVKIDIVNWQTPVAQQYGLRSIPNVRVYDGKGRQVGKATSNPSAVQKYIDKAK